MKTLTCDRDFLALVTDHALEVVKAKGMFTESWHGRQWGVWFVPDEEGPIMFRVNFHKKRLEYKIGTDSNEFLWEACAVAEKLGWTVVDCRGMLPT